MASCYWASSGLILLGNPDHTDSTPCVSSSGHVQCCASGDTCLEGGICRAAKTRAAGSDYYLGGCTDSSFQDSSCSKSCLAYTDGTITYTGATGSWHCCSNGQCSNPSNTTLLAPAPDELEAYTIDDSASPTSTASSTQTTLQTSIMTSSSASTATSTAQSSNNSNTPQSLSTGAKIGIGLGVFGGILLFVALALFYTCRDRSEKRRKNVYRRSQAFRVVGADEEVPDYLRPPKQKKVDSGTSSPQSSVMV